MKHSRLQNIVDSVATSNSVGEIALEWIADNDDNTAVSKQPMLHIELKIVCNKSRDWSRDKVRVWNCSMTTQGTTTQTIRQLPWKVGHWEIGPKEMP